LIPSSRFVVVCVAAFLAACTTLPDRPPVENPELVWRQRQAAGQALVNWDLRGRLSVRTNNEGAQASLRWQREGVRHQLDFLGPFGRGALRLTQTGTGAELRDGDNRVQRARDAESLLQRATGWRLPLHGMAFWVRGLPDPCVPYEKELDEWGRLKKLNQSGWRIEVLDYRSGALGELPVKLFLKTTATVDNSPHGDTTLEVRVAVESWGLSDPGKGLTK
jgi:outer membrane lipoprotein LolB